MLTLVPRASSRQIEVTRQTVKHNDHGESYDTPDELDMKVLKGGELPY